MARTRAEKGMELTTWSVSTRARPPACSKATATAPAGPPLDAHHGAAQEHLHAGLLDQVTAGLPHHAGPELGVLELLDEARDLLGPVLAPSGQAGPHRLPYRREQGHPLDALGAEVGRDLGGGHPPHLLVVGLEEVLVEPAAVVGDDVPLEGALVLRRRHPHLGEGQGAADGLDQTQVAQGLEGLDGVVVELALVVDAAHARP